MNQIQVQIFSLKFIQAFIKSLKASARRDIFIPEFCRDKHVLALNATFPNSFAYTFFVKGKFEQYRYVCTRLLLHIVRFVQSLRPAYTSRHLIRFEESLPHYLVQLLVLSFGFHLSQLYRCFPCTARTPLVPAVLWTEKTNRERVFRYVDLVLSGDKSLRVRRSTCRVHVFVFQPSRYFKYKIKLFRRLTA